MAIVITVPHNCVVPEKKDPGCDLHARYFATRIALSNKHSNLILSNNTRALCDNNRPKCRHATRFRERIRAALDAGATMVLDIHTFRDPLSWKNKPLEVVLLDNSPRPLPETIALQHTLAQHDLIVDTLRGGANDVQAEARERGVYAILIEVRQDIRNSLSKTTQLLNAISQWVTDMHQPDHN